MKSQMSNSDPSDFRTCFCRWDRAFTRRRRSEASPPAHTGTRNPVDARCVDRRIAANPSAETEPGSQARRRSFVRAWRWSRCNARSRRRTARACEGSRKTIFGCGRTARTEDQLVRCRDHSCEHRIGHRCEPQHLSRTGRMRNVAQSLAESSKARRTKSPWRPSPTKRTCCCPFRVTAICSRQRSPRRNSRR